MSLSKDEILTIVKEVAQDIAKQISQQVSQEIGQQQLKQIGQQGDQQISDQIQKAISQGIQELKQGIQGSTQEKSSVVDSVTQNKQEETNTGEAHRGKTYVDAELWGYNKKALVEKSSDFDRSKKAIELIRDQLAISEEQAIVAKNKTLQHVEAMTGLLNVYSQIQNVHDQSKLNAAITEPISPNTDK